MALKGPRVIIETDITNTCPVATNRGVVLVNTTVGSGVALGDSASTATLASNPSGNIPVGMLLNDVVSIDLTHYHINFQQDQVPVNYRVTLLRKGRVTTDQLLSGKTTTFGNTAYLTSSGQLTPTVSAAGGTAATPKVGQFVGSADANGFVTVDINLPNF